MGVDEVLAWLERRGTKKGIADLARYGVTATRPFGVSMGALQSLAKSIGSNHELAVALWATGRYEARLLATLVDDPERVTKKQMNAWAADFDNWGICDTACFKLFDKTPYAWDRAKQWASSPREFVRRAGFAMTACLALHDKVAADDEFLPMLALIERGAGDDRNFVKKGVSWALRAIGRRNPRLRKAALDVAGRLAASSDAAERWVGKDALRDLTKAKGKGPSIARET